MKFDSSYENTTSEGIKSFNSMLSKVKESVLEEYQCMYDTDVYNYILSSYTTIGKPETKITKVDDTIYTMCIVANIQFIVEDKLVEEVYNVFGDCFFECIDLIISLLQIHAEAVKKMTNEFEHQLVK